MFLIGEKAQSPFATVWAVEDKGNYVQGRISTSEKDNREEGKYINSNWFARFVGNAKEKSLDLAERDRIKILSGKITNVVNGEGENRKSYLNVIIFDFEKMESSNQIQNTSKSTSKPTASTQKSSYKPPIEVDTEDSDELPFK